MKAQASTPAEQPKEETVKIERPVKPRKPADYDHSEALADPESASGKYLAKQEQYMDGLADYMDSIEANRSKVMEQQIQQQEVFTRNQKVISDLQSQYNYTAEQANDFINKMSSPQSLSLDNLVKLHQMDSNAAPRQVAQVTPEALQKQQLMSNRQEKLSIPKPIGVQPGASTQSSKSVEDQMMDSMINRYKKKNPF